MRTQPRIVVLGGGTGSFTLLQSLKQLSSHLTAIVNMSDDGGSTGVLRDELGVLPPGDVRQCLVALSDTPAVRDLFSYRFSEGRFRGQSLGNIILSGLELQYGSFEDAIRIASELLNVQGQVVPVTLQKHILMLRDGRKVIQGESHISNHAIEHPTHRLWLEPEAHINPQAKAAILEADLVVIAPGNFYSSLLPICTVEGVAAVIQETTAQVVSVTNLVNKHGQTNGWHVVDYVRQLENRLGAGAIDVVLYNDQPISDDLLKKYAAEGEFPVEINPLPFSNVQARAVGAPLVAEDIILQDPADTAIRRTLIRHDAARVCLELQKILVEDAAVRNAKRSKVLSSHP